MTEHSQIAIKDNKKKLRAEIRKQRRSLSHTQQKKASANLIKQIKKSKLLLRHQHIALYLGNDGELNPQPLIKQLWKQKKQVYLPVIHPFYGNRLCFCQVSPKSRLLKNKFGILEPDFKYSKCFSRKSLSLVLMPLVAFDKDGNRMGMGGGFYDRSFAYKAEFKHCRPKLIGLAHSFQEQECLPIEKWDIPLEGVLTDQQFYQFKVNPKL
jgi:5-formyltetrahydrofolate cyclo-ligase